MIRAGPVHLMVNTEEERIAWVWTSSLGSELFEHILGTPGLGSNTGKASLLSWFENQHSI